MRLSQLIISGLLILVLAGCTGGIGDLENFVSTEKAKPGTRIPPLREVKPYEKFSYDADTLRSPFQPPVVEERISATVDSGIRPDQARNREYLEQFPLDTMRMVGTLYTDDALYGLLQTDDGLIHRVRPGNYIGQNHGNITEVSETEILLVEIVADGLGGFIERKAGVALSEDDS
ncbi:MAG: pilus assembly protein PilP [Gammaproteobacteria bacterium]|nr:pilus assembly protein PilP [Gammaproteobacteria bacterium]